MEAKRMYIEEDQEYLVRRKQRQERWQQELRQRRRRRRILIRFGVLGALLLGVILLILALASLFEGKKEAIPQVPPVSSEQQEEQIPEQEFLSEEGDLLTSDIPEENVETPVEFEEALVPYVFTDASDVTEITSENVISSHAVLVDESTDTIVAKKHAYGRISPASMTKVLTILVAAEHISEEQLDDTFTMTLEITDYAFVNDCSVVGFLDGEVIPVRDLFYGTILPSGADAAVGLATYVAGSQEAFMELMNEKLAALGLAETAHFTNCVGLYDENHYCTLYDMAIIMKAAIQNEWCKEVLSAKRYTTAGTAQHPEGIEISNWFLRRIEDKDTGGEMLCAKTGYVMQSQNCAVSYGTSVNGTPYICVTAGSTSSWRCIYDHVEIFNRYVQN